jgi:hypothetical protein
MWQLCRHKILADTYRDIKIGDVVSVEYNWIKFFALIPHRTVSKRWVWFRTVYYRRVWVYTGFIDEPEKQYGELFDILRM